MAVKLMHCETRGGHQFTLNIDWFSKIEYVRGCVPRLLIQDSAGSISLFAGANFPTEQYDPYNDLTKVTLQQDDGCFVDPFAGSRINLESLYHIICNIPTKEG